MMCYNYMQVFKAFRPIHFTELVNASCQRHDVVIPVTYSPYVLRGSFIINIAIHSTKL